MDKPKWVKLMDVASRIHADLVESYLKAHGIEVRLLQESYETTTFGFGSGEAQILVPDFQLIEARKLYEKTGWEFDATEIDEDMDEEDE